MIYTKGKVKGEEGEVEGEIFINSGSDVVLLPKKVAKKIKPKYVSEGEFTLADGSRVRRDIYEIEIELEDSNGKKKRCNAHATIEEREDIVASFEVLEKLRAVIDTAERKITFKID